MVRCWSGVRRTTGHTFPFGGLWRGGARPQPAEPDKRFKRDAYESSKAQHREPYIHPISGGIADPLATDSGESPLVSPHWCEGRRRGA